MNNGKYYTPEYTEKQEQWAVGIVGNTVALQASVPGSIPGRSTRNM